MRERRYVLKIPATGWLLTSSPAEEGWAEDEFRYGSASQPGALDQARMVWGESESSDTTSGITQYRAFIGTKSQFLAVGTLERVGSVGAVKRLYGIQREGVRLEGMPLVRSDLRGADLRNASLRGADLHRADLTDATAYWADLRGANLQCANLRRADLWHADLRSADFRRADLRGALLEGARLDGALLEGADLRDAKCDATSRWPKGFDPRGREVRMVPLQPGWTPLRELAGRP